MKKKSIFIYSSLVLVILVIVYFKTDIIYNYTKPKKVDYNYGISDLTKQKALKFKEELIKDTKVFNYEDDFRSIALEEVYKTYSRVRHLEWNHPELVDEFDILKKEMNVLEGIRNYNYIARICRAIDDYELLGNGLSLKEYYNDILITTNNYEKKLMALKNRVVNIEKNFLSKDNFIDVLGLEYKLDNEIGSYEELVPYERIFKNDEYNITKIINITSISDIDFLYLDFLDKQIQKLEDNSVITGFSTEKISSMSKEKYEKIREKYNSFVKNPDYDNHLYLMNLDINLDFSKESRDLDFRLMEYYFLIHADFYAKEMDKFDEKTIKIPRNEELMELLYEEYNAYKKELINSNSNNIVWLKNDFIKNSRYIEHLLNGVINDSKDVFLVEYLDKYIYGNYIYLKSGHEYLELYKSIFNL
ncbi:hypothetical protein WG909_07780 [Peptostreptococcaceae bacterium AGR-M142]